MDKPVSLSVKDWIIRNMSVSMRIQERVITTVINHQMDSALEAMNTCNSLEFSGWGKFYFNKYKARKKLEKMQSKMQMFEKLSKDESLSSLRRSNAERKLEDVRKSFGILKLKLDESETHIRGMAQSPVSPGEAEGGDRAHTQGEDADMRGV